MIRRPVAAGGFYPGSESLLRETLDTFFSSLGGLPEPGTPSVVGGLAPHAGYEYSGQVAAHTYLEFRNHLPDTFVVLGPNHRGIGSGVAIVTAGTWESPLGPMVIDEVLARDIFALCDIMDDDVTAHSREHSIEVQVPFIQYIGGKKFVPICLGMQDEETAEEVGTAIAEAAHGKNVGILASSDLTHFGSYYGFLPTREDPLKWMKKTDGDVLKGIEEMSPEKVYEAASVTTACGYGCIAAMIIACQNLGLKNARVLEYRTSYDVSGDESFIVGYGSAVVT